MKLKNPAIVAVISCGLTAPVFAKNPVVAQSSFSALDTQQLFVQNNAATHISPLSLDEMESTEGAFAPWVIRGGVMGTIGAAGGAWNAYNNGATGWGMVKGAGAGFAIGATGGIAGKWLGQRGW